MKKLFVTGILLAGLYWGRKAISLKNILSRAGGEMQITPSIDWSSLALDTTNLLQPKLKFQTRIEIVNPNPVSAKIRIGKAFIRDAGNNVVAYADPKTTEQLVKASNVSKIQGPAFIVPLSQFFDDLNLSTIRKVLSADGRKQIASQNLSLDLRLEVNGLEINIVKPLN